MKRYAEQHLYEGEYIVEVAPRDVWGLVGKWCLGILFCWLIAPLVYVIVETVIFNHTELVLTNRRLIFKRGVFNIKAKDIPLPKVKGVSVQVTFWGRIFNWGVVYIDTEYGTMKYKIQDAEDFKTTVIGQLDQFERDRMAEQSAWMAQALLRGMNNNSPRGQYGAGYGGRYGSPYGGQYGGGYVQPAPAQQNANQEEPLDPYGGYGRNPFARR
jgi:hypothetical protein